MVGCCCCRGGCYHCDGMDAADGVVDGAEGFVERGEGDGAFGVVLLAAHEGSHAWRSWGWVGAPHAPGGCCCWVEVAARVVLVGHVCPLTWS